MTDEPRPGVLRRGWAQLAPAFEGLDVASTTVVLVATTVLITSRYQGSLSGYRWMFGRIFDGHAYERLYDHLYWFGASVVLYGLVPLLAVVLLRGERLRDYGLGLGDWRLGLKVTALFFAIMVPIVWLVHDWPAFRSTYPLDRDALRSWTHFLIYEPGYWAYFVAWEFLFRGFLLFGLFRRIGNHAIWVQLIPFVLMHAGKPQAEAYGSIIAGVALAVLALRTRSFWYGALLHAGVAGTMDLVNALGKIE